MWESIKNWVVNAVRNWKTTLTGVVIIFLLIGVYNGKIDKDNFEFLVAAATGYGFILAKDKNVTGTAKSNKE